jgi:hypothetical protein
MSSFVLAALLAVPGADPLFLADSDGPVFLPDTPVVVAPLPKPASVAVPAPPVTTYYYAPTAACRWVWTGWQWVQVCPR